MSKQAHIFRNPSLKTDRTYNHWNKQQQSWVPETCAWLTCQWSLALFYNRPSRTHLSLILTVVVSYNGQFWSIFSRKRLVYHHTITAKALAWCLHMGKKIEMLWTTLTFPVLVRLNVRKIRYSVGKWALS